MFMKNLFIPVIEAGNNLMCPKLTLLFVGCVTHSLMGNCRSTLAAAAAFVRVIRRVGKDVGKCGGWVFIFDNLFNLEVVLGRLSNERRLQLAFLPIFHLQP